MKSTTPQASDIKAKEVHIKSFNDRLFKIIDQFGP